MPDPRLTPHERKAAYNRRYHAANRDVLNAKNRAYHQARREANAEQARAWRQARPEEVRAKRVARRDPPREASAKRRRAYGLSDEQYRDLLVGQAGRCLICLRVFQSQRDTHVDHDHVTGRVRGLLCSDCNRGLGCLGDDSARLRAAAAYLERS